MLAGRQNTPYDAADISGGHMQDWNPYVWSPDGEINMFRDRMVSRVRDLVRNDGWASAAVTRTLDNVIGPNFSPTSQPDYAVLQAMSGNKKFDHKWAEEWGQAASANYRAWANDPGKYCDSTRFQTVPQMLRLGFRHYLADGEAIARDHWIEERVRRGGARYATAVEIVDPDRLSNPQLKFDQQNMRGGVEVDARWTAVAYWLREAHQGDYFSAAKSVTWERVPRETRFGRPLLIHYFDRERANQHRGVGFLTPIVNRLKMLIKYDSTELDAAIINAFFAAYIESAMLGNGAAATGLAAQQSSQNWAEINYSSFRAAMLEAWKTFHRRRFDFVVGFAQPIYANFLEESVEVDDYPMPSSPPSWRRGAPTRARVGWGRVRVTSIR
jgi:lambda family phage portal protein